MGRGALSKVRWKNDRIKKKRERDKRRTRAGASTEATPQAPPAS